MDTFSYEGTRFSHDGNAYGVDMAIKIYRHYEIRMYSQSLS